MIKPGNKANFETMKKAFANGDICLVECKVRSTGELVDTICAVHWENGEAVMAPLAMMFNENPYVLLSPPEV